MIEVAGLGVADRGSGDLEVIDHYGAWICAACQNLVGKVIKY